MAVVACALALHFGEQLGSDREAKAALVWRIRACLHAHADRKPKSDEEGDDEAQGTEKNDESNEASGGESSVHSG